MKLILIEMKNKKENVEADSLPKLISKHDAAFFLGGISLRTLSTYRKQGKLIGYRIGGVVKYSLESIYEYINNSKIK